MGYLPPSSSAVPSDGGTTSTAIEQVRLTGRNTGDATLPAVRVVAILGGGLALADARDEALAGAAFGLLLADVPPGALARPVVIGPVQDARLALPAEAIAAGALYLGHDGALVTADALPADRRFTRQVATALAGDLLLIDPQPAISR